ncbi:MAG TPA: hypothetical protein VD887_02760 [Allosphingosinicella sp.]|nr:hypothetical protein [Allosphingosinicella sp.]
MRRFIALLLAVAAPAAAQNAGWRLTPDGYGPIRIGMNRPEIARLVGAPLEGEEVTEGCLETHAAGGWNGMWFMFEDGRLSRISISARSRVTTPRGIGVGSTEAAVRRAYPRGLRDEEHEYQGAPASYLTFWVRPNVRGVRFVTDRSRRVRTIHAGAASIQYVEGCL